MDPYFHPAPHTPSWRGAKLSAGTTSPFTRYEKSLGFYEHLNEPSNFVTGGWGGLTSADVVMGFAWSSTSRDRKA